MSAAARKLTNCGFITNISLKKALKLNLRPGRVATVPDRCARQKKKNAKLQLQKKAEKTTTTTTSAARKATQTKVGPIRITIA